MADYDVLFPVPIKGPDALKSCAIFVCVIPAQNAPYLQTTCNPLHLKHLFCLSQQGE